MKVLLVDDDPDFREMVASAAPPSIEIVAVDSSRSAVSTLDATLGTSFAACLVDVHLDPFLDVAGGCEGVALTRWLRGRIPPAPVVLVSSLGAAAGHRLAAEAGALGFLRKPFELVLLYRFLEAFDRLFLSGDATSRVLRPNSRTMEEGS